MKQSSGRALHTFPLRFPGHFYLPQPPSPKPEAGRVSQPRLPRSSYLDCWGSNPGCPACLSSVLPERSRCITHSSRSTPGRSRLLQTPGPERQTVHSSHTRRCKRAGLQRCAAVGTWRTWTQDWCAPLFLHGKLFPQPPGRTADTAGSPSALVECEGEQKEKGIGRNHQNREKVKNCTVT